MLMMVFQKHIYQFLFSSGFINSTLTEENQLSIGHESKRTKELVEEEFVSFRFIYKLCSRFKFEYR